MFIPQFFALNVYQKIVFCSALHSVEFILFNDFKMKYFHMQMNMLGFILISLLKIL
jgi:hypothetical protein